MGPLSLYQNGVMLLILFVEFRYSIDLIMKLLL